MSTHTFTAHATQTLEDITQRISQNAALDELDFDLIDGVLTLEFDQGKPIILNRQEAAQQIWLASPEGPAHFSYDEQQASWLDQRRDEDLFAALNRILSAQTGAPIVL